RPLSAVSSKSRWRGCVPRADRNPKCTRCSASTRTRVDAVDDRRRALDPEPLHDALDRGAYRVGLRLVEDDVTCPSRASPGPSFKDTTTQLFVAVRPTAS